jgi:hypothetical protein
MTETSQEQTGLAALLEERLMAWELARKPQELKLLECYQDVMRIPRDDDTTGTGVAKSRKAKSLFIGSTRNKVRAARAKIVDALLGAGKMPFDTNPTNEELAPFADVVEDIITEQMERGNYKDLLKTGVNTLATYGTGFAFGPFVRKETITETNAQQIGATTQIIETKYEYDFPYFELANTLDVFPDAESRTIENGLGCFWVTMESPHTVRAWKDDQKYSKIDEALVGSSDSANETGSDRASQMRGNVEYWHKNNRIKVARFFGKVPAEMLDTEEKETEGHEAAESEAEERKESMMVDAIVIMAGGVVVKVDKSPYGKAPVQRCLYEAVEHEIWGVGVAENNAPHQKVTNAAFRLFMEGKGMALLGTKSVDRSKFLPTEDFKKFPGKVYQMKPGLSPDERKDAIIQHNEPDITGGWLDVIRMSENFSDDDTGITKYTQGTDSSNLNKTASGISMIMSASSLPIKEVIQNIDSMWIERHVECFIDWDLKYLEPETVEKIHGKEHAAKWAQIKQFGKSSFMDWQATGTSSFMQKEVLTNKIRAFSEFALSNPATAQLIDVREMLQQTWDVMEIGRESPILEEDKAPSPEMQKMQEQIKQMSAALENAHKEVTDLEQAAKDKDRDMTLKEDIARANANKAEPDPNAVDQTQIEVAKINAQSAKELKLLELASNLIQSHEVGESPAVEAGEPANDDATEAVDIQGQLAAQMQALQMIADTLSQPKNTQIVIQKQADGSFVGQRIENGA